MYNFPKKWSLDIKNIDVLSGLLGFSVDSLQKLRIATPKHYRPVKIPKKKKGEFRDLSVPSEALKKVQGRILKKLLSFDFPDYVQGGIVGRSIIKNALAHRQQKWLANLDLCNFFPSVHRSRAETIFLDLRCSENIAKILARLVTYNHELPQGAPTSPAIANLVLHSLDQRIFGLCAVKSLKYTRYFDDITISGNRKLEHVCDKITEISSKESFPIHLEGSKRFKIIPSSKPQIVTGFVVNGKKLKVHKEFLSKLENNIEDLENERLIDVPLYEFLDKIKGMIAFLQSVQPIKAQFLSNKLKQIDPDKYRLDSS